MISSANHRPRSQSGTRRSSAGGFDPRAVAEVAKRWMGEHPYVVAGVGILLGTALGYWSKRR